jgi:hypothetical protein
MSRRSEIGPLRRDRGEPRSITHAAGKNAAGQRSVRSGRAPDRRGREHIPVHALPAASGGEPLLIENRPHRDYVFPIRGDEALGRIAQLPESDTSGITHVWLRRMGPKENRPFGSYAYGPGYAVIILYPWPRSLRWWLGPRPPSPGWRRLTERFDGTLGTKRGRWYASFTRERARRFFLDDLILHEVGHHVDWRRRSPANRRQVEEFADQYAASWARRLNRAPRARGSAMNRDRRGHLERLLRAAYPSWAAEIEHGRSNGPHPELTVSFRLFDRRRRPRTNEIWMRPSAIDELTVAGVLRRVERANQQGKRRS